MIQRGNICQFDTQLLNFRDVKRLGLVLHLIASDDFDGLPVFAYSNCDINIALRTRCLISKHCTDCNVHSFWSMPQTAQSDQILNMHRGEHCDRRYSCELNDNVH